MPCDRCGTCCKQVVFSTMLGEDGEDTLKFWRLHNLEFLVSEGRAGAFFRIKCDWYDNLNGACLHYDDRPKMCRDFLCNRAKEEK